MMSNSGLILRSQVDIYVNEKTVPIERCRIDTAERVELKEAHDTGQIAIPQDMERSIGHFTANNAFSGELNGRTLLNHLSAAGTIIVKTKNQIGVNRKK